MARSLHELLHTKHSRAVWVAIIAAPLLVVGVRAALGAGDGSPIPFRASEPAATTESTAPGELLGPTTPPVLPGATAPTPVTPPPVVTVPGGSTPTSGTTTPGTKPSGGTTGGSDSGARAPVKKALVRNDRGRALYALPTAKPGVVTTSCVLITYNGAKAAKIRLYGKSTGTGLQQFVTLRVTRGTLPRGAAARSCSGFKADAKNYKGLGKGVIYNGVLASFANTWAKASSIGTAWKTGAKHAYKFEVQIADTNSAQGLSTTSSFTWEARAS